MNRVGKNDPAILAALAVEGWYETYVLPKIRVEANGCWRWIASGRVRGYGQIGIPRGITQRHTVVVASRVVWIKERGPIPADHVLDHDGPNGCSNKACVRPDCLQAVTIKHNLTMTGNGFGAVNLRKEACPHGHPYTPENLSQWHLKRGSRLCLACGRRHNREARALASQAAAIVGIGIELYIETYGSSKRLARRIIAEASVLERAA